MLILLAAFAAAEVGGDREHKAIYEHRSLRRLTKTVSASRRFRAAWPADTVVVFVVGSECRHMPSLALDTNAADSHGPCALYRDEQLECSL